MGGGQKADDRIDQQRRQDTPIGRRRTFNQSNISMDPVNHTQASLMLLTNWGVFGQVETGFQQKCKCSREFWASTKLLQPSVNALRGLPSALSIADTAWRWGKPPWPEINSESNLSHYVHIICFRNNGPTQSEILNIKVILGLYVLCVEPNFWTNSLHFWYALINVCKV